MNRFNMTVAAIAVIGASASAQTYVWDDGSLDNSIGFGAPTNIIWLSAFQISGLNSVIQSVEVAWQDSANTVAVGQAYNVHIWSDPTNDGDPTDAVLENSVASNVTVVSPVGGGTFETVNIVEALAGGAGTWFFVGLETAAAGTALFPAAIDLTAPHSNHAWIGTNPDPNNLAGILHLATAAPQLNGDWMIRANASAVPEPGTFIAIGIGLAALALRRRSK